MRHHDPGLDHLWELHGLQILNRSLADGTTHRQQSALAVPRAELVDQLLLHSLRWHNLSGRLLADSNRYTIQHQVLEFSRNVDPTAA